MNILERIGPFCLSFIVALLFKILKINFIGLKDYKFIYSNIISVSSIMIGALITMVAILTAFTGKRVMKKIKENKVDGLLQKYFVYPIVSGLAIALYSIVLGVIFDEAMVNTSTGQFLTTMWAFLTSYFIFSSMRVFYVMLKLLNAVFAEDTQCESITLKASSENVSFDNNDVNT